MSWVISPLRSEGPLCSGLGAGVVGARAALPKSVFMWRKPGRVQACLGKVFGLSLAAWSGSPVSSKSLFWLT